MKLIIKHGARVLNPAKDIIFSEINDSVVIIFDGIDHMKLAKDQEKAAGNKGDSPAQEVEEEESDSEEEKESGDKAPEEKKQVKKQEEEMPVIYSCPACTFENPVSAPGCEVCGTERPPMEVIIADFRRANQPPVEDPKTEDAAAAVGDSVKKKPLVLEKLELLAADVKRIISRIERKVYKEKLAELEKKKNEMAAEAKAKQEAEEKKAPKVEEEKKPAEKNDQGLKKLLREEMEKNILAPSLSPKNSSESMHYAEQEEMSEEGEDLFLDDRPPGRREARGERRQQNRDPRRQKLIDMGYDPEELE